MLMDLSDRELTGKLAETALDEAGITVNKNTVPNEKRSPFITSGVRLGTPALTTRGMKEKEMMQIAQWISQVLSEPNNEKLLQSVKTEVQEMCLAFPIYGNVR